MNKTEILAVAKPILFNTEMVRAILNGRKTVTRRLASPLPIKCYKGVYSKPCEEGYTYDEFNGCVYCADCGNLIEYSKEGKDYCNNVTSRYQIGDYLYVRETWNDIYKNYGLSAARNYGRYAYLATDRANLFSKWKPSIHMPKEAARLLLKVTAVRVERLQEITEEQARAEGIVDGGCYNCGEHEPCGCDNPQPLPTSSFAYLWDSVYSKSNNSWIDNPWVWVYEFERVEVRQ